MKSKQQLYLSIIFCLIITPFISFSQGTTGLKVTAMPGFPFAPADSAYEGQAYSFSVTLANNTSTIISTPIDIQFRVDSITNIAFTVGQPALGVGDTATFSITGYNFSQPQFKLGNNIVVVWPSVNGLTLPVDSFIADVIFVPLSGLFSNNPETCPITLYPIPSSGDLHLSLNAEDRVEYVRIYSIEGRQVYEKLNFCDDFIDISRLRKGTYLFEAVINGKLARTRFVRN